MTRIISTHIVVMLLCSLFLWIAMQPEMAEVEPMQDSNRGMNNPEPDPYPGDRNTDTLPSLVNNAPDRFPYTQVELFVAVAELLHMLLF